MRPFSLSVPGHINRDGSASLSCSYAPQGLFRPAGFISILLFCSTGIILAGRIHLYLALLFHRDYFGRPDSSLSRSFVPQGLFCPGQMHLYLALLYRRDYFARPDASHHHWKAIAENISARPFRQLQIWHVQPAKQRISA